MARNALSMLNIEPIVDDNNIDDSEEGMDEDSDADLSDIVINNMGVQCD